LYLGEDDPPGEFGLWYEGEENEIGVLYEDGEELGE